MNLSDNFKFLPIFLLSFIFLSSGVLGVNISYKKVPSSEATVRKTAEWLREELNI